MKVQWQVRVRVSKPHLKPHKKLELVADKRELMSASSENPVSSKRIVFEAVVRSALVECGSLFETVV